jgi:hypothetical protein
MLHHGKYLALCAWLLTGTAATAQVSPEIAYAKGGGRAEVYLTNTDGTGRRLLYRGAARTEIFHVDIRPGGGELAFEEHSTSNSGGAVASAIKVIKYDASGSVVGPIRTLQLTCLSGSLDYHATEDSLLYRNCSAPARINSLNTTTWTSTDLGLPHHAFVATWLDATNLLYYVNDDPNPAANNKYWKVSTANLASPTQVVSYPSPGSFDPSTSGDKVLLSGFSAVRLIDVTAGQVSLFQPGNKGHFSPDDQHVLYITGDGGGQFMLIRRTDGAGSPANLAGKGNYTAVDWRN